MKWETHALSDNEFYVSSLENDIELWAWLSPGFVNYNIRIYYCWLEYLDTELFRHEDSCILPSNWVLG